MKEKPWTYVETRSVDKSTGELYKIKVDLEDLGLLKNKAIYIQLSKTSILGKLVMYRELKNGFVVTNPTLCLSKLIFKILNQDRKISVIYLNEDPLDLRKSNLKIISKAEDRYKSKNPKKDSKPPRGVYVKSNQIFSVISVNRKNIYLGSFDTVEEASKAYEEAKKKVMESL